MGDAAVAGFGEQERRSKLPGRKWPMDAVSKESRRRQKKMEGLR